MNSTSESYAAAAPPREAANQSHVRVAPLVAIVLLSVALQTSRLLEGTPLMSANDRSRWCTVWSLVERGTYQIDEIRRVRGWDTIDKVKHQEHYYSSKPPLLPTMVAGVYWAVKHTLGWTLEDQDKETENQLEWTGRLILFFVNIIPMTIALLVLARMFQTYCESNWSAMFLTATASFGTLILPFSKTFNNHTVAFVCVVFAVQAMVKIVIEGNRRWNWFASAGFFAAFACCNELPAASLGVVSFLWLARLDWKKTLVAYVPFAVVPLAAFLYTNFLVTGGLKPFYMYYGTEKYEYVEGGVPSYWMQPKGIDQAKDDPMKYLFHCTVGHHGLFSLTPVLLGVVASWLMMITGRSPLKPIIATGFGLTLLVFGFYMTRTENYNYGGVSVALRWMLWLLPFWLVSLIPLLNWGRHKTVFQIVAIACLGVSIFSAWYPSHGPWTQPWMFRLLEDAGYIDYSDPPAEPFERPVHTWIMQLPVGAFNRDSLIFAEFESPSLTGDGDILQLIYAGTYEIAGRDTCSIQFGINPKRPDGQTIRVWIDVERFNEGAPVNELLVWPNGEPSDDVIAQAEQLLTGLPKPAEFSVLEEGGEGYLRVLVPGSDAFHFRRAAAHVALRPEGHSRDITYRRDIWINDRVPFGVLQFETTISDYRSGQERGSQTFILRSISGYEDKETPATE